MVELNELQAKLKKTDGFRVKHTQSVKETAVKMAKHHNVDLYKVKIASLLHDYARHFNNEKLKKIVKENPGISMVNFINIYNSFNLL